jgi:hypothetical protein
VTPYVNVPLNFARHLTLLEANPLEEVLAPYKDDDTAILTIRSRTAMFVPFELVTCLLGKDYTARDAFELCYPVLDAEGLEASCAPFLDFLQLASTKSTTYNPRPVTLWCAMPFVPR